MRRKSNERGGQEGNRKRTRKKNRREIQGNKMRTRRREQGVLGELEVSR